MDKTVEEDSSKLDLEPDWFNGILNFTSPTVNYKSDSDGPIQQDDEFKPFLFDIGNFGLNYAYQKYYNKVKNPKPFEHTETKKQKEILIIGAGMSGLVCGYELAQVGHKVHILEMQHRVGGRVKTVGDEKFYQGLWSDAGAMRLPGDGTVGWIGPSHYMTDFYAQKFKLPRKQFINTCDTGFYCFYGHDPIKMEEWNKNSEFYCTKFWPDWKATIKRAEKENPDSSKYMYIKVKNIEEYWAASVKPVTEELRRDLKTYGPTAWRKWVIRWGRFSVKTFLNSSLEAIIAELEKDKVSGPEDWENLQVLKHLLPWPLDAIIGYEVFSYTLSLDVSLVDWLRDELGQWWKDPMHTYEEGLGMLPKAFANTDESWKKDLKLSHNITFGVEVHEIHYERGSVEVKCHNRSTKKDQFFTGDIVIVTLPLNIVRQIMFSPPLPIKYYKAIANISYSPSTKIMLQCKTQFWQEDKIEGGFSKTNLPIGRLHYPSNPKFKVPMKDRGILMCYTWKQEALLFGSQSSQDAIAEAVKEISFIHPKIYDNFEVGAVQAWYSDPSAQGAFSFPKPEEYQAQETLFHHHGNVFFCGEGISTSNGWIQGALVSGLRAAYQLYELNENDKL